MKLATFYLESSATEYRALAVWHARRALALAREEATPADLPVSLLVLGYVLVEVGQCDEARQVLEEGKRIAPPDLQGRYQSTLAKIDAGN
jgi:hypothetical protein